MTMFSKPVKAAPSIDPSSMSQTSDAADAERRNRALKGGRGASFLWDAAPIAPAVAKPSLMGG